jgi:hypothetical protein
MTLNHRWIVGDKLCLLLNQYGLVVGWACASANVPDNTLQPTFKGTKRTRGIFLRKVLSPSP